MKRLAPVAVLLAAGVLASAAQAHPQPPVPSDIAVPDGNAAYLDAHAVGVQIYSCNGTAWTLVAPRANLYDHGKLIATHFAGPTWQTVHGSSQVVGKREAGVNVDPTAIDWLRLAAVSTTPGRFGETTYIQRIHTAGGIAPAAADCTAGTAGVTREVPYTADYVFFKKARRGCAHRD
jgi:uncharacterized protein DUF3455